MPAWSKRVKTSIHALPQPRTEQITEMVNQGKQVVDQIDETFDTLNTIVEILAGRWFVVYWRNLRIRLVPYKFMFKFGIGGANMPTRTPIPVSRAMRQISANLDLAQTTAHSRSLAGRAGWIIHANGHQNAAYG